MNMARTRIWLLIEQLADDAKQAIKADGQRARRSIAQRMRRMMEAKP